MRDTLQSFTGERRKAIHTVDNLSGGTKDLLSVLSLLLLSIIFFGNVLFTDDVLVGDNLAGYHPWRTYADEELIEKRTNSAGDPLGAYYPQRVVAAQIVQSRHPPLWNPYYLAGVPFLATEPYGGFFYPPNLIYYLIAPLEAFGHSACLHLFLAGTFMYAYLRSIELNRPSSLFGAFSFGFAGYFLMNLMYLPRICPGIWTPLILACFERYWKGKGWTHAIILAFAIAMCLLAAGSPIEFVFIMFGSGSYFAFNVILALREGRDEPREIAKRVIVVVAAISAGVLLSAVQLFPSYEAAQFAERARMPYEARLDTGRSVVSLATAIIPDIFGNPADHATPSWAYEQFGKGVPANYATPNVYAGILPLILSVWALSGERKTYALFFAGLAVVSISIFLDVPSLIFRVLYLIPIFRTGRQVEIKILYGFAVAVLGALGFASLLEDTRDRRSLAVQRAGIALILLGIAVLLAVGVGVIVDPSVTVGGVQFTREWYPYNVPNFLRFALLLLACSVLFILRARDRVGSSLLAVLAIALVVVDLFYFGWKFNPPQNPEEFLFETDGIRFLQQDEDIFRIMRGPGGRKVLPPNTPAVFGISDAQGYAPLLLDYYADFMNLIEKDISVVRAIRALEEPSSLNSKLLDLLNVKYVLTRPREVEELTRLAEAEDNIALVYDGDMKIYENKDALPRAFTVPDFKVVRTKEEIFAELASDGFDPASYVVLEEEPQMGRTGMGLSSRESSAAILQYQPNRVIVEAEMGNDGFLILSDRYYDGWRAFVDGEESRLYKADYVFRAVQLSQGRHVIEFVFDPVSFRVGLLVSGLTLLALVILLVFGVFKGKV